MSNIVIKPWGSETILTEPDLPYTGKIFEVKAGARWSLQYHDQKTETLTLIQGQANLLLGTSETTLQTISMEIFKGYTIHPNQLHRVEAITDSFLLEVSTTEAGTTFRLQDDYNRPNETPEIRYSPNRGWGTTQDKQQ